MRADLEGNDNLLDSYFREHEQVVQETFRKLQAPLLATGEAIVKALKDGGKVLAFGNGGSATQASHFAGELVGRFSKIPRKPLPAIALSSDSGIVTCIGNDFGYDALFERQVDALAEPGDVAIAFTTSGKSQNVLRGLTMAARKRAVAVALTGEAGLAGAAAGYLLNVPSGTTSFIQEVHLMFVHLFCVCVDKAFIGHSDGA